MKNYLAPVYLPRRCGGGRTYRATRPVVASTLNRFARVYRVAGGFQAAVYWCGEYDYEGAPQPTLTAALNIAAKYDEACTSSFK